MNGGDRVERRRRRFATFVAEPAAPLELGLDRSEALGALWMLAGLVPTARRVREVKGWPDDDSLPPGRRRRQGVIARRSRQVASASATAAKPSRTAT
jgi:hypothetical protein